MRKVSSILLVGLLLLITACDYKEEITHVGVNAEIIEISNEVESMVVRALDQNSILVDRTYINCESPETYFLYVDNATGEITEINFKDLAVGDQVSVDIKSVENKYALTSRVQLLSQRR